MRDLNKIFTFMKKDKKNISEKINLILLKKIGSTLKHNYQGCTIWIISSDIENMKLIGLRPSRKIKVMNGDLECSFREFQVYKGSKKDSKQ